MTRLSDKELRVLAEAATCTTPLPWSRQAGRDDRVQCADGRIVAISYGSDQADITDLVAAAPALAAEVLELRKVARAVLDLVSVGGGRDPVLRWKRLADELKLDKPRGKRAKGVR